MTPETDDKRCVKEGKMEEEKDNCSDSALLRRLSWKNFSKDCGHSIWIQDLSEAQEQDESKRQTMFMSIVMGA